MRVFMRKLLNGWTDNPLFKLAAPVAPLIVMGLWAWLSGIVADVRDTKIQVASVCSTTAELKAVAGKLSDLARALEIRDAAQEERLKNLERQLWPYGRKGD